MTDSAEERRALSDKYEKATWPPKVGERIHHNSGWGHTSWTGEVRAIVDNDVVVLAARHPGGKRSWYWKLVDRLDFELRTGMGEEYAIRKGPLPKPLWEMRLT